MSFIKINNRNNFLIEEVRSYHPDSHKYLKYWKEQKRRCIEGFWSVDEADINIRNIDNFNEEGYDNKEWRWMPPNLYYYVNFGIILHKPKDAAKTAPKKKMRPHLRDFEWEFFYNFMECRGFSGFEKEDEYTSLDEVKIYEKDGVEKNFHESAYKDDGTIKKYIPCSEYIRKTFNSSMGKPIYQNEAKNLFMLGARGGGKSYLVSVGVVLFEILFDGARYYNNESINNPAVAEVFVGAAMASKSSEMLSKTRLAMDNLPGAWKPNTNEEIPSPLHKTMKGSLAPNNIKNPWRHLYDIKTNTGWKENAGGSGSSIHHGVFTTENPEAAAGGRKGIIIVEEVGLLQNVLTVTGSNTAVQMTDGTVKFGSSIYIGTGGNIEKIIESEIIFRDPIGFEFLSFDDEWENTGKIGWFVPAYYMDSNFKDENGNTLEKEAIEHYNKRREAKKNAKSSKALDLEMMNYPLIPSEMFLTKGNSKFPVAELKSVLSKIMTNKDLDSSHKGHFEIDSEEGKIKFKSKPIKPILEFPLTKSSNIDMSGCVEILEMPKRDNDNIIPAGRYIAGNDPIDDDDNNDEQRSLQSTWVMDTWTSRIVAEYTGRTRLVKEYYEQVRRMLLFYNATLLYENQKKGLFAHFDNKNSLHLLADTPQMLRDMDMQKPGSGNRAKGIYATTPINEFGLNLIIDWLLQPAYNKESTEILNLHTLRSAAFLREMIMYSKNLNTDRVSSFGILMIYKESMLKLIETKKKKIKTLADDPFFSRNFGKGYKQKNIFNK